MAAVTANGFKGTVDFATFRNIINNELADTEKHRYGINPATRERLPDVPVASKFDLENAVKAARTAFTRWRSVPREERNTTVLKFADLIEANADGLTKLLISEQGKPLAQAMFEVGECVAYLRAMVGIKVSDEVIEDTAERKVVTRFTPLGVVGAIVPWNFPCLLNIGKIGPAVLMGNTIIVKPSPFTPYSALKLSELAAKCFPPGVVQALSGDDDLGPWMTAIDGIDKISFTGSTVTGRMVAASAAPTLKRLTLELGGKDPAIICASVDIPKVAREVSTYAFLNSGQVCMAIKRVYIHSSIYDAFRDAMVDYVKTLKVGHGLDDNVFFGPIQNEMQYKKIRTLFDEIDKEKWRVAVGGTIDTDSTGYFVNPTIIDNPDDNSTIVSEEPFGPILPILSWNTEEEVIARANASDLGLGASVWSENTEQADRIGRQIEAGTVWVNTHFDMSPVIPFGGHKQSGLGVEWGVSGMKGMCNQQTVNIHKIKQSSLTRTT